MQVENRTLGGMLLVAGTTIGAGILALPVVTGFAGFIPTVVLLFGYWIYMTFTAFLLLEANLWMGENINLITMAHHTLGRAGELVSWVTYLLLLYLLTTAYLAGGGPIVTGFIRGVSGVELPVWVGAVPLLVTFGFFVYEGTKYVDVVNRILMFGLIITYALMTIFLTPHVHLSYLSHIDWKSPVMALSLVATSFGFHIIIPTLTTYMHRDIKQLKRAIFFGSLIPLVVYLIWAFVTLGVIPLEMITYGYQEGLDGVTVITKVLNSPFVEVVSQGFSFFAIVTSFLGVTLSLTDFLSDGLHIKKTPLGRCLLTLLTFVPPLIFILTYPRAFLSALEFAGVYGVIILLGLLPPLMVWAGRYKKGFESTFKVPGGKITLILAILISLTIIFIEIGNML